MSERKKGPQSKECQHTHLSPPGNWRTRQSEERKKRAGYLYSKPKVGSQFQAKVSRIDGKDSSKKASEPNKSKAETNNLSSNVCLEGRSIEYKPSRVPVCVHRPFRYDQNNINIKGDESPRTASSSETVFLQPRCSDPQQEFLIFARNLFLQSTPIKFNSGTEATSCHNPWLKDCKSDNKEETNMRPGSKRKAGADIIICNASRSVTSIVDSLQSSFSSGSKGGDEEAASHFVGLENDEEMLAYLQSFGGDLQAAKVALMAKLSNGSSVKRRSNMRRKVKKLKMENGDDDIDWTQHLQQLYPTMYGDLNHYSEETDINDHPYPFHSTLHNNDNNHLKPNCKSVTKAQWKTFLSACSPIIKLVNSNTNNSGKKPHLTQVSSLLNMALNLPPPASCIVKETMLQRIDKHISCLVGLQTRGRDTLSKLLDLVQEGVDLDVLKTSLKTLTHSCPVRLEEGQVLNQAVSEAAKWEKAVEMAIAASETMQSCDPCNRNNGKDSLSICLKLLEESKKLFLYPKSVIQLKDKVERAQALRDKVLLFQQRSAQSKTETVKFIASLVREANRINLSFPEASMVYSLHQRAEDWIEHATRAHRYRIGLQELDQVIVHGEELPLNLSDQLDRLKAKAKSAHDWIKEFEKELPCPMKRVVENSNTSNKKATKMIPDHIGWLINIRNVLNNEDKDDFRVLLNLSVDGSRIPVDMEPLRFLNLEMEARNWSLEAKRLLSSTGRRGKIDELYAHISKGQPIIDKAPKVSDCETDENNPIVWVLPYEDELKAVVTAADEWYDKYQLYFGNNSATPICETESKGNSNDGDDSAKGNPSPSSTCNRTSILELREMVKEGEKIPINLGTAFSKVSRVLAKAEAWLKDHYALLYACGNKAATAKSQCSNDIKKTSKGPTMTTSQLNDALTAAANLPIDLEDVYELKDMAKHIQKWIEQANLIVPKRQSKRNTRGKGSGGSSNRTKINPKPSLRELVSLIEQAPNCSSYNSIGNPLNVNEDLQRLQNQLNIVQSWRIQAQTELKGIVTGFAILKAERVALIDKESNILFPSTPEKGSLLFTGVNDSSECSFDNSFSSFKAAANQNSKVVVEIPITNVDMKVDKLLSNLLVSAMSMRICTIEEKVAEFLEEVISWCFKASSVTPDELLEKKSLDNLPAFISCGDNLLEISDDTMIDEIDAVDVHLVELLVDVRHSWSSLVKVELERLHRLKKRGDDFFDWIDRAEIMIQSSEKQTLSAWEKVFRATLQYPTSIDLVRQIRKKGRSLALWVNETRKILKNSSKMTLKEANERISKGEEFGLICDELKILRQHVKKSKAWASKVKKCNIEDGNTHVADIKQLIDEHNNGTLIVTMPDELATLKQAIKGYCLCRNPYEGFMIGCDGCDEWYHGTCVGISEATAERCEKYLCIRCCVSRMYKDSSDDAINILLKWKNRTELAKQRTHVYKNYLKRVRHVEREIVKWTSEVTNCNLLLAQMNLGAQGNDNEQLIDSSLTSQALLTSSGQADDDDIGNILSLSGNQLLDVNNTPGENQTRERALSKSNAASTHLAHCTRRLEAMQQGDRTRKEQNEREDQMFSSLQKWFLQVGKVVLVPESSTMADSSRPNEDGTISHPMYVLIQEANMLGISSVPDVCTVVNTFHCLAWCLRSLRILSRKPTIFEIESLHAQTSDMKLPNEKAAKFLRGLLHRAGIWQNKVRNALRPSRVLTQPFDLEALNQLLAAARGIPMVTHEETRLINTIEDKGARHCVCGGPGDGTFMLNCDQCHRWFHGVCMRVDQNSAASLSSWVCPLCEGGKSTKTVLTDLASQANHDHPPPVVLVAQDSSSPPSSFSNYLELWPPKGLLGSDAVNEVLGSDYGDTVIEEEEMMAEVPAPPPEEMAPHELDTIADIANMVMSDNTFDFDVDQGE